VRLPEKLQLHVGKNFGAPPEKLHTQDRMDRTTVGEALPEKLPPAEVLRTAEELWTAKELRTPEDECRRRFSSTGRRCRASTGRR